MVVALSYIIFSNVALNFISVKHAWYNTYILLLHCKLFLQLIKYHNNIFFLFPLLFFVCTAFEYHTNKYHQFLIDRLTDLCF